MSIVATDNYFLTGRFAPVSTELTAVPVAVDDVASPGIEALPSGIYLRNGPNPVGKPRSRHHWFLGDGMLHAVNFSATSNGGKSSAPQRRTLTFTNRWLRTETFHRNKYSVDNHGYSYHFSSFLDMQGGFQFTKFMAARLWSGLTSLANLKQWNPWEASCLANTNVIHFNGKTYALVENAAPLELLASSLETFEPQTFGGTLKHPFTAHPKVCPQTGEMYFFGYQRVEPYVCVSVIGRDGVKGPSVDVGIDRSIMMHDFAITNKSIVLLDLPLLFDRQNIFKGKPIYQYERTENGRIGVLARTAVTDRSVSAIKEPAADGEDDEEQPEATTTCADLATLAKRKKYWLPADDHDPEAGSGLRIVPVKWFNVDSCVVLHTVNAQESFDTKSATTTWTVHAVAYDTFDMDLGRMVRPDKEAPHLGGVLRRWELSESATGARSVQVMDVDPEFNIEFPVINPKYMGLATQYAWAVASHTPDVARTNTPFEFRAVVKYDLARGRVVAQQRFDGKMVVDEFIFVEAANGSDGAAKSSSSSGDVKRDEDDGFLVGYATEVLDDPTPPAEKKLEVPPTTTSTTAAVGAPTEEGKIVEGTPLISAAAAADVADTAAAAPEPEAEDKGRSYFVVLSAKTLAVLSKVELPQRVPHGFHGTFVPSVAKKGWFWE